MTIVDLLTERNADFAAHDFDAALRINPSRKLTVICCVDPRVDPCVVLGVKLGEAAVIRNVGGRVTPATVQTMAMLSKVGQANGAEPGPGRQLVVLHHTDCGMTDLAAFPDLLATYFGIGIDELDSKGVSDPYTSIRVDVELLRRSPTLSAAFQVWGMVYDVGTGLVETVIPADG
jgi:carbonic anhydrase